MSVWPAVWARLPDLSTCWAARPGAPARISQSSKTRLGLGNLQGVMPPQFALALKPWLWSPIRKLPVMAGLVPRLSGTILESGTQHSAVQIARH